MPISQISHKRSIASIPEEIVSKAEFFFGYGREELFTKFDFIENRFRLIRLFEEWNLYPSVKYPGRWDSDGDVSFFESGILYHIPIKFGIVKGDFFIPFSKLESLVNSPIEVGGQFNCKVNRLVSLEGGPLYVGGSYDCMQNPKLRNLKGLAPHIGESFFACRNKNHLFTVEQVKALSNIGDKILV